MRYHYSFLALVLLFCQIGQTQDATNIVASRTSGIAPLFVFFDATAFSDLDGTMDLVNTDFSWDFDLTHNLPGGRWQETKGMVVGHVFEQPGSYTVRCTATSPNGQMMTEDLNITVSAFSGRTYYVSTDGNDTWDGLSLQTAWRTANFAFNQLSAGERILFRRGDTFIRVSGEINNQSGGAMLVGSYGSGAAPILESSLDETAITINASADIRLTDLHIINTGGGPVSRGLRIQNNSANILIMDVEIEGSAAFGIYPSDTEGLGVVACHLHDFGVIGTFVGDCQQTAWIGNTIDQLIGTPQPEHGMRFQGGQKHSIIHNMLSNLVDTKTAITVRGDGQQYVMLYDNRMDRLLQIGPQNAQTVASISQVVVEANYIGHNAAYYNSNFDPTPNAIVVEATRVVIRNNVIDGYWRAINVRTQNPAVEAAWVDIYHNTANWRVISPISGSGGILALIQDAHDVQVHNNLLSAPSVLEAVILQQSNSVNIQESHNLVSAQPQYNASPLPNPAAHINNPNNYQLSANSPALEIGSDAVPVFYDFNGDSRPFNTFRDVGAFEYQDVLVPLGWLSFTGRIVHDQLHELKWEVLHDGLNSHFIVERSSDGRSFFPLQLIAGRGLLAENETYYYEDHLTAAATWYYRIRQQDVDGSHSYSPIIQLQSRIEESFFMAYPNPFQDIIHLNWLVQSGHEQGWIAVYDSAGSLILQRPLRGDGQQLLRANGWQAGLYHLHYQLDDKTHWQRIIKR